MLPSLTSCVIYAIVGNEKITGGDANGENSNENSAC